MDEGLMITLSPTKVIPSVENVPPVIYPNPLNPPKYVIINSGLMGAGSGVSGERPFDAAMRRFRAVLKVNKEGPPEGQTADFSDEYWKLLRPALPAIEVAS